MKKIKFIIFLCIIVVLLFIAYKSKNNILKNIYPVKYDDIVEETSQKYNLDKYLVYATIKAESNFNENAESKKGAKGLMQLMETTAVEVADSLGIKLQNDDILNPEININLGTKYLSDLMKKYGDTGLALSAYNAGSGKVDGWIRDGVLNKDKINIEDIPYSETKKYVKKILIDYEIYKKIYQEEG